MLTLERLRQLMAYDAESGCFTRCCRAGKMAADSVVGYLREDGYLHCCVDYKFYLVHRLVWLYVKGTWPAAQIDHINGVKDDNRIVNLRDVTNGINGQNLQRARKSSASKLLGAFPHGAKWIAQIGVAGKKHHLGTFDSAADAHAAYMQAKAIYHPSTGEPNAQVK